MKTLILSTLLLAACGSSLVIPDDPEVTLDPDGGIDVKEILDASDGRDIPAECSTPNDCYDGDPCTEETCSFGECQFNLDKVKLSSIPIATVGVAVDVALGPDLLYVAEGVDGVEVFDISNRLAPRLVGTAETEGEALAVASLEGAFAVAEGEDGLQTFASLNMQELSRVLPGEGALLGVDSLTEVGVGPTYSIGAAFSDGITIMNLANVRSPTRAFNPLETTGRAVSAAVADELYALVADSLGGALSIVFESEEGPMIAAKVMSEGRVVDVAVSGQTGLMAEYGVGFGVLDLSDPLIPERLAEAPTPLPVVSVALLGPQTGVIAEENGRVAVIDLLDPKDPDIHSFVRPGGAPRELDVSEDLIAVALGASGAALIQTNCALPSATSDTD